MVLYKLATKRECVGCSHFDVLSSRCKITPCSYENISPKRQYFGRQKEGTPMENIEQYLAQ